MNENQNPQEVMSNHGENGTVTTPENSTMMNSTGESTSTVSDTTNPVVENQPILDTTNNEQVPSSEESVVSNTPTIDETSTNQEVTTPTTVENPTIQEPSEPKEPEVKKGKKKQKKQKDGGSGYGCASFLFLIILFLTSYILFDKGIVSYNKDTNEFKFMQGQEVENAENQTVKTEDDTDYYVSSDGKYFLVLGHENKYFSSQTSQDQKHFILDLRDDASHDMMTGGYQIENGKITLVIAAGCQADNGDFNCKLPSNVVVNNIGGINSIVLNYTKDRIMLGNIELINEKNLTE